VFQRVLVPLDDTPEAGVALPPALAIARSVGAAVRLVRVVDDGDEEAAGVAAQSLRAIAAEVEGAGVRASWVVRRGRPAEEIVDEAEAAQADLIVMATHGRSGIGRAVLGSVADGVIAHSRIPVVLLKPGGHRMAAVRTLLVPVDGSPGGALAVGAALGLARATRAKIVLVQVVVPLMSYALGSGYDGVYGLVDPGWDEEMRAAAREYVGGLASRLVRAGVSAEGRVVDAAVGSPSQVIADALAQAATDVGADMVVMSTHALTGPARTALGSVADAVVRGSHRPVLLLRRGRPLAGSRGGAGASAETA